jgi:DUF4097 and DUF4098 domain-containing protein YvlB
MVEEGKISAADAANLLSAVNTEKKATTSAPSSQPFPSSTSSSSSTTSESHSASSSAESGTAKSFEFGWSQKRGGSNTRFDFGNIGKQIADAVKKLDPERILKDARTNIQRGGRAWQDRVKHWSWFGGDEPGPPHNIMGHPTATANETLSFDMPNEVVIQADNHWGEITVEGGHDSVSVDIVKTAWAPFDEEARALLNELRVIASQHSPADSASRLELHTSAPEEFAAGLIHLRIKAPSAASVRLATLFGDIRVKNVSGKTEAQTGSGKLDLETLGETHVESISGDIHAAHLSGRADIVSRGGAIYAQSLKSGGEVSSVSGDVAIGGVEGNKLVAKSVSGELSVEKAGQDSPVDISVESVSGDLRLHELNGALTIKTVSGDVRGDELVASVLQVKAVSGDIDLSLDNRFTGTVNANTVSGDVTVRLKEESSFRYSLSTQSGDLKCELAGTENERRDGVWSGSVGGGEGTVNVSTLSGDVHLAKPE